MKQAFQHENPATGCQKCPLLLPGRQHVVWGRGPSPADILMVGEAPGFNEDREGLPFVGRAGQILNNLLKDASINRDTVHIANRVMCRPPDNRDPEPDELENCTPWLVEHTRQVQPKALVLFGRSAISWFFDRTTVKDTEGLMYQDYCFACGARGGEHKERYAKGGLWVGEIPEAHEWTRLLVAAIYHPASALGNRNPENAAKIVKQLKRVKEELHA
jgi:uracil-DNA glycosylase family 4